MVGISMYLFGKPEWEFDGNINSKKIKSKGDELKSRLHGIADATDKLIAAGWECEMTLYDLCFYKKLSKADAEDELKRLNIPNGMYAIEEDEDEDEEE